MTRFVSEALGQHDRSRFACGNSRIDDYFRNIVSQDVKRLYAACYVLTDRQTTETVGFYTLSAGMIPIADMPPDIARKLPRYPTVPAARIGWMGRDRRFVGQNIGAMLLHDAIHRVIASQIGVHALFVDAIDEDAAMFYRKQGFVPLNARPMTLFLPMATARKLALSSSRDETP